MKLRNVRWVAPLLLGCLLFPVAVRAQSGSRLSEVQKAYADVDYERTQTLAAAAIRNGGNDRSSTGELYLLWATALAALDQAEEARLAFSCALAANPELKLDRSLSPKLRAPYLEARGGLSSTDGKPPLEVTLRRHKQQLELGLRDSLHVAASVVLATRPIGETAFVRRRFDAAPTRRLPAPNGSELQFVVQALDRYGNVLFEQGSEDEPQRLVFVGSDKRPTSASSPGGDRSPVPYYVTSGALAALGVGAGAFATVMYLQREDAAREWNSPSCEAVGLSRAEQCGGVDERRKRAQALSVGFAAAGTALLLGSVVTLVLAPSSKRATVALDAGPGDVMLRLRTTL